MAFRWPKRWTCQKMHLKDVSDRWVTSPPARSTSRPSHQNVSGPRVTDLGAPRTACAPPLPARSETPGSKREAVRPPRGMGLPGSRLLSIFLPREPPGRGSREGERPFPRREEGAPSPGTGQAGFEGRGSGRFPGERRELAPREPAKPGSRGGEAAASQARGEGKGYTQDGGGRAM